MYSVYLLNCFTSGYFHLVKIWLLLKNCYTLIPIHVRLAENGFWCIWNLKEDIWWRKISYFCEEYFYDCKPMRSIFDILHKNFQEDQLNNQEISRISRRVFKFQISRISRSCRHPVTDCSVCLNDRLAQFCVTLFVTVLRFLIISLVTSSKLGCDVMSGFDFHRSSFSLVWFLLMPKRT